MDDAGSVTSLRPCGRCREWLPVDRFHRRGPTGYHSWCKSCRRAYDAEYLARHRDHVIAQKRKRLDELTAWMRAQKNKPCMDCGGMYHAAAMTFDHRPGVAKRADIATLAKRTSIALLRSEIEKCDLVCANCHAVRTYVRREAAKAAA